MHTHMCALFIIVDVRRNDSRKITREYSIQTNGKLLEITLISLTWVYQRKNLYTSHKRSTTRFAKRDGTKTLENNFIVHKFSYTMINYSYFVLIVKKMILKLKPWET